MKINNYLFCLLAFVTFSSSASNLLDDIIDYSNINDQLPLIQEQLQTSLTQQVVHRKDAKVPLTAVQINTIRKAYENSFNPNALKIKLRTQLEQSITTNEAQGILIFLKSPLGLKITQADKAMSSSEFNANLMMQGERLNKQLLDDVNRYDIIKDVERYSDAGNTAADSALMVQFLMAQNDWYYSPPSPRKPSLPELMKMVGQQKQQMLPIFKQMTHVALSQVYKNLTDAELESYIVFLKSSAGQAYYGKMAQALKTVLFDATQRTGALLKQAQ